MKKQKESFQVGESVRVKADVKDPDLGNEIAGWQGRVQEIHDDGLLDIAWDSVTMKAMGMEMIVRCENENLDWRSMTLGQDELENVGARDTEEDVEAMVRMLVSEMFEDPRLEIDE